MKAGKFVSASEIHEIEDAGLSPCYGGNGLRGFTKTYTHSGKYSLIGRQGALCGNVTLATGNFHATEHAIVVTPLSNADTDWMYYALTSLKLNQYATGQAQPGLSVETIERVAITIPSTINEQTKIANFLTAVDERITQLGKKHELLTQYKKGVMQKIFSQELRFKDEDGSAFPEWEEKSLGKITKLITKGTTPKSFSTSGVRFIKIENLGNKYFTPNQCSFIEESVHRAELKRSILFANDILFAIAGSIGKCGIVSADVLPANTNQAFAIIRLNDNENTEYVFQVLTSIRMGKYILDNISVGAQPNLNLEQMNNFSVPYPSVQEQTKIANFLTAIDDKISAVKSQIDAAKQYKQGLLQQMFI